jgi:hypothetical protein
VNSHFANLEQFPPVLLSLVAARALITGKARLASLTAAGPTALGPLAA